MLSYLLSLGSSYHVLLLLVVALGLLYKLAAQLWWRGEAWRGSVPKIYRRGGESRLCDHLVRNCSALTERCVRVCAGRRGGGGGVGCVDQNRL